MTHQDLQMSDSLALFQHLFPRLSLDLTVLLKSLKLSVIAR